MTMQEGLGRLGSKRSSWSRVHYRDLALKICQDHPEFSVEALAQVFSDAVIKHPEFMESISIYIMANIRAALTPRNGQARGGNIEDRVVKQVAAKAMTALMILPMPSGKTLGQSTGEECIKVGGWLERVGKRVGPRGIVGRMLSEKDLQAMWKKK